MFDIIISSVAVVIFTPILLPIMLALRLTGEGEVFYRQTRVGRNGRCFELLKLATMLRASPTIGAGEITLKNDPRILPFGRFLRKAKLNELPQILNVLKGDMSLVGPRPMVPSTFALYPEHAKPVIYAVRPGLTGIGSIVFRDEERYLSRLDDVRTVYREIIIPYKADLECWFVAHSSLSLYFKIITVTAWVLMFPNSSLVSAAFKGLPDAPDTLKKRARIDLPC